MVYPPLSFIEYGQNLGPGQTFSREKDGDLLKSHEIFRWLNPSGSLIPLDLSRIKGADVMTPRSEPLRFFKDRFPCSLGYFPHHAFENPLMEGVKTVPVEEPQKTPRQES
jgi:hypothetical protein